MLRQLEKTCPHTERIGWANRRCLLMSRGTQKMSHPLLLVLPVCLLLQVRGGVCGVEHCPGQPHLCALFRCLHQQLPRPDVSPLILSRAAALLGSRRAAVSGKGSPRFPGGAQPPAPPHLTDGDVPREIQIKVISLRQKGEETEVGSDPALV